MPANIHNDATSPIRDDARRATDWLVGHPTVPTRVWPSSDPHDVRGDYLETYWLPILGPSAVLALRRLALELDAHGGVTAIDVVELGASLGLGTGTGRNTTINRTLMRLISFGMARIVDDHLEVRDRVADVPEKLQRRLPPGLRDRHDYEQRH